MESTLQLRSNWCHRSRTVSVATDMANSLNPLPLSLIHPCIVFPILLRKGGGSWTARTRTPAVFFETMSKRRMGFPSETKVKRGVRIVHGNKELAGKLG